MALSRKQIVQILGEMEETRELEILSMERYNASLLAEQLQIQKTMETFNATKAYRLKKKGMPFRHVRS